MAKYLRITFFLGVIFYVNFAFATDPDPYENRKAYIEQLRTRLKPSEKPKVVRAEDGLTFYVPDLKGHGEQGVEIPMEVPTEDSELDPEQFSLKVIKMPLAGRTRVIRLFMRKVDHGVDELVLVGQWQHDTGDILDVEREKHFQFADDVEENIQSLGIPPEEAQFFKEEIAEEVNSPNFLGLVFFSDPVYLSKLPKVLEFDPEMEASIMREAKGNSVYEQQVRDYIVNYASLENELAQHAGGLMLGGYSNDPNDSISFQLMIHYGNPFIGHFQKEKVLALNADLRSLYDGKPSNINKIIDLARRIGDQKMADEHLSTYHRGSGISRIAGHILGGVMIAIISKSFVHPDFVSVMGMGSAAFGIVPAVGYEIAMRTGYVSSETIKRSTKAKVAFVGSTVVGILGICAYALISIAHH